MSFERVKRVFQNKAVRAVLVCLLALVLLVAVWKVFFGGKGASSGYVETEREARLSTLLAEIAGVDGATVMIGEEDGVPVSAVVIFKGEDGLVTRSRIVEVAANALRIARQNVLVYPAETEK